VRDDPEAASSDELTVQTSVKRVRIVVVHHTSGDNRTLSYQHGWPRHFRAHPSFACSSIDLVRDGRAAFTRALLRGRPQAVVLLHSVFSNSCLVPSWLIRVLARLPVAKAYFIGNEYKLMPEKMAFCNSIGLDLLVSQITSPETLQVYRERLGCAVAGIPNTGLDPGLFSPRVPRAERPVDLGYRAYDGPLYLCHVERRQLFEQFSAAADRHGLVVDLSLDRRDRLAEAEWAGFLNRCKGQLGFEAGGDYFELTDATRTAVNAYVAEHPDATIGDVRARFFADYRNPVPGRALSGRIVEAAGTKTVQILLEGEYGGYFHPGEHYIPLRKDFSNLDEAIEMFKDEDVSRRLTEGAYRVALEELTYPRLIDRFRDALEEVL
jgi:hypothetical protein